MARVAAGWTLADGQPHTAREVALQLALLKSAANTTNRPRQLVDAAGYLLIADLRPSRGQRMSADTSASPRWAATHPLRPRARAESRPTTANASCATPAPPAPYRMPTATGLDDPATSNGATPAQPSTTAPLSQRLADARVDLLAHLDGGCPSAPGCPAANGCSPAAAPPRRRTPEVRQDPRLPRARRRHGHRRRPRRDPRPRERRRRIRPPSPRHPHRPARRQRATRSANASPTTPGPRSSSPTATSSPRRLGAPDVVILD